MKFNVMAFALTCSLVWGGCLLFVTWWIMLFEGATGDVTLIGQIYRGYDISPLGSIIGMLWGLVDGFIGGAIFAWLYNWIVGKKA
ncbi:MAG: hypothetical protein DRP47_07100 [Candidatus Zixiibacteriota bacterium]|nr:MAG: hypothetical protein DRP47_07100 [candidate division Zixibacteria bacterium]